MPYDIVSLMCSNAPFNDMYRLPSSLLNINTVDAQELTRIKFTNNKPNDYSNCASSYLNNNAFWCSSESFLE